MESATSLMEAVSLSKPEIKYPSIYKSVCAKIDKVETDILFANHSEQIVVIATQYKKLGSLLTVSKDCVDSLDQISDAVYTVKAISGREKIEEEAAARFIAESLNIDKKLYVFLSLKSYDKEIVKAVADAVFNLKHNLV